MADYDSGLPIRSEADGTDERVHVKIVDGATPSQMATVDTDLNVKVGVYGDRADDGADVALLLSEEGRANGRGDYEFDEKLIDCFLTGTVPIFWGCPSIDKFFKHHLNRHCILLVITIERNVP